MPDVDQEGFRLAMGENTAHVLIGPLVFDVRDKPYFMVIAGPADPSGHAVVTRIDVAHKGGRGKDKQTGEAARADFALRVFAYQQAKHPAIVIHDFDDELQLATWADGIWPGERFKAIKNQIMDERKGAGHA